MNHRSYLIAATALAIATILAFATTTADALEIDLSSRRSIHDMPVPGEPTIDLRKQNDPTFEKDTARCDPNLVGDMMEDGDRHPELDDVELPEEAIPKHVADEHMRKRARWHSIRKGMGSHGHPERARWTDEQWESMDPEDRKVILEHQRDAAIEHEIANAADPEVHSEPEEAAIDEAAAAEEEKKKHQGIHHAEEAKVKRVVDEEEEGEF